MSRQTTFGAVATCLLALGCSGAADGADAPDTPTTGSGGAANCSTASDSAQGTGTVSGALQGASFGDVATSLWIGVPDSAASTVIYLFSKPVVCSDLCAPGWDTRIGDGTQILELKALGVSPASFPVVKTATPAPGEAVVNSTIATTGGTPSEIVGSAGSLTLSALQAQQTAKGTFELQFGSDALSGSFNAAYCPEGHEP